MTASSRRATRVSDEKPPASDEQPDSETPTGEGPQEAESLADTEADLKDVLGSEQPHGEGRLNLTDEESKRRN